MAYSVNFLTTRAECDAALKQAGDIRERLDFRLTVFSRSQDLRADSAGDITANLAVANAQITALTAIIPTLPAESQPERELEKRKYERERDALLDRQQAVGSVALLSRELEVVLITLQLAEVDAYLGVVNAHKATLAA
ncbi:hypothetical protein [Hymenobacter sp.]|uniref:hypothetical protein n=1 Tax=Hymenobacter sp. TaxID=1898978 RepID=UPI00286D0DF2|nr:hypothetical protein [Hymenobacter sp.]